MTRAEDPIGGYGRRLIKKALAFTSRARICRLLGESGVNGNIEIALDTAQNPERGVGAAMTAGITTLRNLRVLIVEDEFLITLELEETLTAAGAEVIGPVGWLDEAIALVEQENEEIDFAVLDVDLHGARSYPVADILIRRGIPFVFATGFDASALAPAYRDHPRCAKPVDGRKLLEALAMPVA